MGLSEGGGSVFSLSLLISVYESSLLRQRTSVTWYPYLSAMYVCGTFSSSFPDLPSPVASLETY